MAKSHNAKAKNDRSVRKALSVYDNADSYAMRSNFTIMLNEILSKVSPMFSGILSKQNFLEGCSKFWIENGIYNGVKEAVGIT